MIPCEECLVRARCASKKNKNFICDALYYNILKNVDNDIYKKMDEIDKIFNLRRSPVKDGYVIVYLSTNVTLYFIYYGYSIVNSRLKRSIICNCNIDHGIKELKSITMGEPNRLRADFNCD